MIEHHVIVQLQYKQVMMLLSLTNVVLQPAAAQTALSIPCLPTCFEGGYLHLASGCSASTRVENIR